MRYLLLLLIFLYVHPPAVAFAEELRVEHGHHITEVFCSEHNTDWKAMNATGFLYYLKGDLNSATYCYLKSIETNPKFAVAHNNMGVVYLNTGDLKHAEEYFQKAVDINPNYVKAIVNLAVTNYRQGKIGKVRVLVMKAKSINPEYVDERIVNSKRKRGLVK